MKKTLKTAMTSAMFAAAVGVSAGSLNAGSVTVQTAGAAAQPSEGSQTTTSEPDVMLGGDVMMPETTATEVIFDGVAPMPEETTTTEPDLMWEGEIVPETTEVELGGAVPIIEGDLNYDFLVNAKDLTLLKRAVLEGERYYYENDINHDGVVDQEDIKALRRMLTGKSKAEEDAEEEAQTTTTTAVTEETVLTELTTMTETIPAPLYGPPEYFE